MARVAGRLGCAATPVPDKATLLVVGVPLWPKLITPLRVPVVDGVKRAVAVHDAPGNNDVPALQVVAVSRKSVPETEVKLMLSEALPVLVSVTLGPGVALPTVVSAKASVVVDVAAIGAAGAVPEEPYSETQPAMSSACSVASAV